MKSKFASKFPLIVAITLSSVPLAPAATLYWDGTDSTADADGGSGAWTTANAWDNAATGGANATFANNDTVFFGGTAGTVTASAALTAAATTFSTAGYNLNLTATAPTTYTLGTLTGAPTINVTLGTGSATASFGAATNFSAFTGIINVGTASQGIGSGKAGIASTAGPLPASATVNVRANSTLYVSTALTHLAPITLNGGDPGETFGQLRLDNNANWGGTVTLAGDITSTTDANIGSSTGLAGTVSGNIVESGGARTLIKGSTGLITLSGTNSFTGGTIVRAGTLTLDYSTNNTNKLSDTATVTLAANSTLRFTGNAGAATNEVASGLTLLGFGTTLALDTAPGQPLTADFSGGGSGVLTGLGYGLNITTSGTGTAQLKLPGTTPSSALPGVTINGSVFASTDASNFVVPAGTLDNASNDLATWISGPTQYTTAGADFINQVGAGVVINGITFSDPGAARTVTIGGGNTLTLNRGIIVTSAVGTFQSTITGGTIQGPSAGALAITNFNGTNQLSIASTIADNGGTSLVKTGVGTVELTAANSYTGGTIINGGGASNNGSIKLGNIGALGSGPVTILSSGNYSLATTNLTGSQNLTNNIVINNFPTTSTAGFYTSLGAADVMEFSGVISGGSPTTSLMFNANAVTPNNTGVKFIISGNNSYTAANTFFYDGGIRLNHPNGFGTSRVAMFQSADTALEFGGPMTVSNAIDHYTATKRIDTGAFDVVLSGIQTFWAPTTKTGTGKLTLSATNDGTANLTVGAGTLALGASGSLSNNVITVAGGAVFDTSALAGGFSIATGKTLIAGDANAAADVVGSLTLASGGVINPAGDTAAGTLTVDGNLTLNGGTLRFSDVGDQIALTGASRTLSLSGTNTVTGPMGFLAPGTYTLASGYTSHTGDATNLSYNSSAVRGGSHSFDVGATVTTLTVNNSPPLNLTWSGATGGLWDVNTSANWNTGTEKFYQNDNVTFADAPANSTVTINGTVTPGSIAFTNAVAAYTVRGGTSPVIAGTGAMTKTGGALVTLWHPSNTYTGGTTINAGTVLLQNSAAPTTGSYSPLGTGLITITGGTLMINPANGGSNTFTFPNALRLNGGMLYHEDGNSVFNGLTTVDAASFIKTRWGGKNVTLAGGLAGSADLTVSDQTTGEGGTVILGTDGSYSGNLTINNVQGGANGAVQLNTANALQSAVVTVNTTAAMDGSNARGLILGGAAGTNFTIAGLSGTQSAASIHNSNDAGTRTLTVNQSGTTTFAGSIGGTSANYQRLNLVKSGAGTLTLTGANTYNGDTTVSAGTLVMPTRTISGTGNVTVADGATLGVSSTGVSLLINDLNLGTSGANTLAITNFTPNGTPVIDALTLQKNATTTISVSGTLVSGSTFPQVYPLIISVEPINGTGGFVLAPLPRGVTGALENDGNSINLRINSFDNLVWKGTAGNTWDLDTTSNWKLGSTDPATYVDGDNVVFDGSAANNTVDLTATVAPTSLTFNFDAPKAYSVSGVGAISGATGLIKNGTGTLTLSTANNFNGITTVTDGSLVLGNNSALGSAVGGTTVADGATLELNGCSTGGETYALDGSLLNNGAAASTLGGAVTLSGDVIIGGTGNIAINAAVSGSGPILKTGPGTLLLGAAGSYSGGTTVEAGTLQLGSNNALGTGDTTVNSGATLDLNGRTAGPVTLNGSTIANSSTAGDGRFGNLTLNGGGTLASTSPRFFGLPGSITGSGDLTIAGNAWPATAPYTINMAGKMVVNSGNIDTYSNFSFGANVTGLVLNGGSFNVNNSPTQTVPSLSGGAGGRIPLSWGGTLAINQTVDGDFAGIISYAGNSAVPNPVVKNGPATLTLSGANTYTGNTTVNAGTLHLATTGRLSFFPGAGGNSNTLSGAGSATLDGGFIINTAAVDSLTTGTWILETMGATSTYDSNFKVYQTDGTAWTDAGGDKWTKPGTGGRIWTFDESNGTLTLAVAGYDTWAEQIANPADHDRGDDPDGDGLTNLQEYLFGKNPTVSDGSLMSATVSGSDLVLRWLQCESGATYTLKESATLDSGSWITSTVIPETDFQPGDPTNYDQWKAVIPQAAGRKFFRIEGVEN